MVSLVQDFQIVKMVKFGMYILIVVNAQIICIGLVQFAEIFLFVREEEFLILHLDASVLLESSGMVVDVHFQTVLEDKSGMAPNVFVQLVEIGMVQYAWSVLMGNNGIRKVFHANVPLVSSGQDCSAIKPTTAQLTESGIKPFKHVFVHPTKYGMEDNVPFNQSVVVEEAGI